MRKWHYAWLLGSLGLSALVAIGLGGYAFTTGADTNGALGVTLLSFILLVITVGLIFGAMAAKAHLDRFEHRRYGR